MKRTIAATLSLLLLAAGYGGLDPRGTAYAQATLEVHGTVIDETGAFLAAAPVVLDDGKGHKYTAQTDEKGRYRITGIRPGAYTLTVEVEGFAKFTQQVELTSRRATALDIKLKVFIAEQMEVKDEAAGVSTEPDKNLSSITLTEKDLEALPDDPDEMLAQLKAMAGAAGGSDDAAIYVGGFRERGRIPPKEAIQMIRINANPFSAEFSEPGNMRIEIVTKPGTDTFHGGFRFNFNDESLNGRNAFATQRDPLQVKNYGGNFNGPIIRNRWGFFVNLDRRDQSENDVVNATVLDPASFAAVPFVTTVITPTRVVNFDIRTDYLATKKHTVGFGYRVFKNTALNQGLGSGFDLPERAFNRSSREHTLRFSLTTIVSEHSVNEARLQLSRRTTHSRALTDETAIVVLESFNRGGNQGSLFQDNSNDNLDFTDTVTYTYKKHTIKAGYRAEGVHLENLDRGNFGGTFTFGSDFERDAQGRPIDEDGNPSALSGKAPVPIRPIELYRRVLAARPGYNPTQFSINRGDPFVGLSQWEMGWFVQDDWRISPRLTLSYGVRHEFQTHLQDKLNFAPRFGLAWVPDKKAKSTIRLGAGIFYSQIDSGITFSVLRSDPARQQQFVIPSPNFFPKIPDSFGAARQPTTRQKSEGLNAPYVIVSQVNYERQLPLKLFGSVGYSFSRGVHLLRSRNINVPFLGSSDPLARPFPDKGPIYQYESTGLSNRHELRFGIRTNISRTFSLFGNYTLASTRSDADGAGSFPANSYDLSSEYGRAGSDARHQVFVGGSISLPWGLRISPFVTANSGRPFNITTGRDNNRDNVVTTDRPAFGRVGQSGAVVTRFGVFNPNPLPSDEIIPRNFGQGPGAFNANVSVSKTFGFGPPPNNAFGARAAGGGQGGQGQAQPQTGQQAQNQGGRGGGGRGGNQGGGNRGGQGGGGFAIPGAIGGGMPRGGGGGGGGMAGAMAGFFGNNRHKYNVTISVNANNIFNHTNFMNYNGVLTSSFFGRANRAGQPRRIELAMRFSF